MLVASIIASSMAFIDTTALNVALPALQVDLHAAASELLWIVNGYGIPLAALLLAGGAAADRFGRKRILLTGIIVFSIASAICGLAPNAKGLISARVFQGIGASCMIPGSLALLTSGVASERRGRAIGVWTGWSVAMTALGPILGGVLTEAGWWRGVFFINIPLAAAAVLVLKFRVSEPARPTARQPIDIAGAVAGLVSLVGFNYGLITGADHGFDDPVVLASLGVGLASLIIFSMIEWRSSNPLVPKDVLRNSEFRAACFLTFAIYSGAYATTFFLSLNLIQVQGLNARTAGLAQLPMVLFLVVISPWVGRVVDRYGVRGPLLAGSVAAGAGFVGLAVPGVMSASREYWWQFFPPLALLGMAMGITISPLSLAVMNSMPAGSEGLASGINSTLGRLSSVLGIALLGTVALTAFHRVLPKHLESLPLSGSDRAALADESVKFGSAKPPQDLPRDVRSGVERAIREAFVSAFRTVLIVVAANIWLTAMVAAKMLNTGTVTRELP